MSRVVFLAGLAIAVFSHPKVMRFFMARLINEGVITPRNVKPEDAEIIKYAGPHLSLLFIGILLMIIGIAI